MLVEDSYVSFMSWLYTTIANAHSQGPGRTLFTTMRALEKAQQYHPPSICIAFPVMNDDASESKNSISGGTSV
jgi:hypothetical protein